MDSLLISLLDCEVHKGKFKKKVAKKLNISIEDVSDVTLVSDAVNGVITHYICICLTGCVNKNDLDRFEYSYMDGFGNLYIEVGDTFL